MGRIVDLCGEIAEAAEEGEKGLVLPRDVWDRLRADWSEDDIEDCLGLVHESLLQGELMESADSLNARLLELLGTFGDEQAFREAAAGSAVLSLEAIGQLARRVGRLEEILEAFRDGRGPDRRGFDELQRRLADHGIEDEMEHGREADARGPAEEEEEAEDE
jgi:hypothetical protein